MSAGNLLRKNIPLAHVCLVVEGTLRISGRDSLGNPFTLRRVHAGEWWGLWSASLRSFISDLPYDGIHKAVGRSC